METASMTSHLNVQFDPIYNNDSIDNDINLVNNNTTNIFLV